MRRFFALSVADNCNAGNTCVYVGGNYNQNRNYGMFYSNSNSTSNSNDNIGARHLESSLATNHDILFGTVFRAPLGEDFADRTRLSSAASYARTRNAVRQQGVMTLKRVKNLYPFLISDENIAKAIEEVNRTHRFIHGRPNKTALWVDITMPERIKELRQIVKDGFIPKEPRRLRRYDYSAGKWRDIREPALWPDQYIHHMVIQTLQPVMMRGMDYWCCGSIRRRGTQRGIKGIRRWVNEDPKHTKYCAELDIHHFYDSLKPEVVMDRMRDLVKDEKMLDMIQRLIGPGIMIGAYFSQWFANTTLQPLDHYIREQLGIPHYVRYMDNLTLFSGNKRQLHRAVRQIEDWLCARGMRLKDNWQVFRIGFTRETKYRRECMTDAERRRHLYRMPSAMGYRFGRGFILLRKKNLLRTKRQITRATKRVDMDLPIAFRTAAGLLSRTGQFVHCNSRNIRDGCIRPGLIRSLKSIVRDETRRRKELRECLINTCLARLKQKAEIAASCASKASSRPICPTTFS